MPLPLPELSDLFIRSAVAEALRSAWVIEPQVSDASALPSSRQHTLRLPPDVFALILSFCQPFVLRRLVAASSRLRGAVACAQGSLPRRAFCEAVEMHVTLRNYDPARDRRFRIDVSLPHQHSISPVLFIADDQHYQCASALALESCRVVRTGELPVRNRKKWKKLTSKFGIILCSESIIRTLPRIIGPQLGRCSKFPVLVPADADLLQALCEVRRHVRFSPGKYLWAAAKVANVGMSTDTVVENIRAAYAALRRELPKGRNGVNKILVKTTMGRPVCLLDRSMLIDPRRIGRPH
eukprot:TRINITY_DN19183_c0_g1_i1.p1 TRINITY_DN19183_c0_g1~~TRINITY_DN19183_c0_g1_i1.p1  ORF type:complete len:308 (+),score=8.18 TRINITY_DN19183_c0_g1_i1:41-925(+)